jgi:hypothetical protein
MANTCGEKELKTDWDEQTANDSSKAIGHVKNLVAEKSFVPARYKVGLN